MRKMGNFEFTLPTCCTQSYDSCIQLSTFYLPWPLLNPLAPGGLVISIHCILCDFFQTVDHNLFNLNQPLLHHSLQNHQCKKLTLTTYVHCRIPKRKLVSSVFSCGTVCVCSQIPYRGNDTIFWIFAIVPCHAFCM